MKAGDLVWIKWKPSDRSIQKRVIEVYKDGSFRAENVPPNGHVYRFSAHQVVNPPESK
jgi:hypothetical protein